MCKMGHLTWLVQVCFLWNIIKIIKTHGEMLSKETIFQLQLPPAVNRDNVGDVIKNSSQICYDNKDTHDDTGSKTTNSSKNASQILNIFKSTSQQIQENECKTVKKKEKQEKCEGGIHFVARQLQEERKLGTQDELEPFSILQQLKLDDQEEKWQQEKQQQQLKLQQQQNILKLQQFMQHLEAENLGKAGSKRKKKKRKKKRKRKKKEKHKKKKQKPNKQQPALLAQPAHILFASPTQRPLLHYHHQHNKASTTTTKKPLMQHALAPLHKIKYILRKNTIFKKKKKEYLNHLKHVLYPFIKFIAFFTIINPFTLAVFLFSLISPVVFGFIGFMGLSFLIKPALNLLFGIKRTVNAIKRRKLQALRRRQRLRDRRRPITIHKHYYQQKPTAPPPLPHHHYPPTRALQPNVPLPPAFRLRNHHQHTQQMTTFNPLLSNVRQKLKMDKYFMPDSKGYNDSFEQF